jgi:hypothetical protein
MVFFSKRKKIAKYFLFITVFSALFFWCLSNASDLLWQLVEPSYDWETIIKIWKDVDHVWASMIEWSTEVSLSGVKNWPSIIVKITRILLSFVVALSITMILYNWMIYIIQTWQWKDSKDLTKNIAYIVVWILVAIFSVVIINLIQSVPKTIDEELNWSIHQDNNVVEWRAKSFKTFFSGLF